MGGPSTKSQVDVGRNGVESRKGCRKEYRKEWCRVETVGQVGCKEAGERVWKKRQHLGHGKPRNEPGKDREADYLVPGRNDVGLRRQVIGGI